MKKLLAANRSEIAVRIFRSATELGYRTVAVYANEDRFGVHRFKADEAYLVGKGQGPVAAYLDIPSIIDLAKKKGVDLIHPGYGFLSENADFARACEENGLTFVGPSAELLGRMGDKIEARKIAEKAKVPTLPGTQDPISDRDEAVKIAKKVGFPLIIKAAFGGGGRGMRVVKDPKDLIPLLDEAQGEAGRAFGNDAVFLERYIGRAKHIEVQILGDKQGNVVHLHERDCSVQRRHQKVIEIAPSVGLPDDVRKDLCDAAVKIAKSIGYYNAGTVEFLLDLDTHEWFFIEMNPRIQVEHTVTEVITGIDIVRTQCLIAQGYSLFSDEIGIPAQEDVPRNGYAIQARITTEDPEKNFAPDYGKIVNYRSAAGLGIRLDGAMGDTGAVITPFYDSLLVKLTASARTFELAIQRMDRALREFRIRGVKTNIPFIENVIHHDTFLTGEAITTLIDTTPALFNFSRRRDRATKLLKLLGETIVNGNDQVKGRPVPLMDLPVIVPDYDPKQPKPAGTKDYLTKHGPEKFAEWTRKQKRLLITDTTMRDAHQSLLAARMRSSDQLEVADAIAQHGDKLYSLECWGGATFDTSMRFLHENPFKRLRRLRERIPNICFQMLLRGANGVGYSNYPDNVIRGFIKHSAECGMDIFRVFDSLNYLPNLKVAMDSIRKDTNSVCEATICYTGDILNDDRDKYTLEYYVQMAQELEKMGAHIIALKDMSGLCHPHAAYKLIKALRAAVALPVHFHTHDSSGIAGASIIKAAEAGVDAVDLSIASLSGLTAQPNLNSIINAMRGDKRDTGLDQKFFDDLSIYWEAIRQYYEPFDTSPKFGSAEVYRHEMPGGQYTNLREQARALGLGARWPEVVRYYHEVNEVLGDIVKVTPSSKVVGDLSMFLLTKGVEPKDMVNLEPGTAFPESVVDMLSGGLGQPKGGWPKDVQKVVLGDRKPYKGRPGARAEKVDLAATREEVKAITKRSECNDDDLYAYLMYPQVFKDLVKYINEYGHARVLPTPAFFYGLKPGEEISVEIEEGKVLIIKLIYVSEPDKEGLRTLTFELNGRARECVIKDHSIQSETKRRVKADSADKMQVGAPIPAMVSAVTATVGHKVKKGDKLAILEAMKMQTTVYALADGIIDQVEVQAGDQVESKDLLVKLR
ncbi:pyruvate carboxylase [Coraliomargarita algicola]|uniref:Pyruvate carboxylase n=2 Tax=Coraliomargaritaceae TaxID=3056371 RepID=A0ABU1AU98_9BACT|nr:MULTISPECIES: pyruvate carboxylase [unclassified Coraliomargarita]MDQ8207748.1 pyruvate carboxylase [Coraliomargarita sp. SDUM461003]WPJ94316.1 pyruvate carboxylase [Coraliomargarita sp. J2-16]